jgi:endonuclease/exonuclease/phosphatase family metal-dependent hydrolase
VAGLGLAGGMSFGVLTLNLWNINEPLEPRYRALSKGLKKLRPEIVCLQEVHRDPKSGRSQAELIAEMCGLAHHVEKSDLAILCSQPLVRLNSAVLPQFKGDTRRHVLLAEFQIEGRPLLVINTHLAYPPEMIEGRRKQAKAVLAIIKRRYPTPRGLTKILCGDFNDVAGSPSVCTVLNSDEQFRDVFSECHPNNPGFTYSPRNRYVERSWTVDERIDYIFVSRGLVPKDCFVVFDGKKGLEFVSDHFGVFSHLKFR